MIVVFALVLLCVFGFYFVGIYNGLVGLKTQLERAWSNIDVILKQRFDEIPQLIQIIEQYVQYESDLLQKLIEARTQYGAANNVSEKIHASNDMSLALRGVAAIGESYPDLKSNNNFSQLQGRISALEESISDRREGYNEAVTNFNTRIAQFPDMLAAQFLGYRQQELFKATEAEKEKPNLTMKLPNFKKSV